MITVGNERYTYSVYKRIPNSAYEYETVPSITFRGRPASQLEKKNYRITQGQNGSTNSIFVISSNLPQDLKPNDRVEFLGKTWLIINIGYYFDESRFVNAGVFSNEYIQKRCPKGLSLQ